MNENHYNSNWKKILRFRNMQEKLEKKSDKSTQKKKLGKQTEETYKRDVKLFQLRWLALNKKGTQLSLENKRKL